MSEILSHVLCSMRYKCTLLKPVLYNYENLKSAMTNGPISTCFTILDVVIAKVVILMTLKYQNIYYLFGV